MVLKSTSDTIKVIVVMGITIIAIIVAAALCIIAIDHKVQVPQIVNGITGTPTPVTTPEIASKNVPSSLVFTVLKTSAAQSGASNALDRDYTVLTTDGAILILPDYYSWDMLFPQQEYTCSVTGAVAGYGRDVYTVKDCNIYRHSGRIQFVYSNDDDNYYYDKYNNRYYDYSEDEWDYTYYHYGDLYWKCGNGMCDTISISRLPAYVTIYESAPPLSKHHY